MSTYAPGPWSYHLANADACIEAIERHGQNMNAVRAIDHDGKVGTVCFLSATMIGNANARLISAAPDLLAALERMVVDFGGIDDSPDGLAVVEAAHRAIAKATNT